MINNLICSKNSTKECAEKTPPKKKKVNNYLNVVFAAALLDLMASAS